MIKKLFLFFFQCVTECILNETGIMKDRMFQPMVASDLAKKALGPKSVWVPIVEEALNTCNEHGNTIESLIKRTFI